MVKVRKLPIIKPDTIKLVDLDDYFGDVDGDCTKCGGHETIYSHTDMYFAYRKYPRSSVWDQTVTLCARCAREEGWVW